MGKSFASLRLLQDVWHFKCSTFREPLSHASVLVGRFVWGVPVAPFPHPPLFPLTPSELEGCWAG